MKIAGINKTTLLDYPEHVAAGIFLAGCNFCCPFCHNGGLVIGQAVETLAEEEILLFLEKRKRVLDAVCISGGEPTLQEGLREFIRKIKKYGFLVKLDTNGYRPDIIEELLAEGLVDYIAMDIKNVRAKYAVTAGLMGIEIGKITRSVELLKNADISYEFRTTVIRELHSGTDLMEIGAWIGRDSRYYLQAYEDNENVISPGFHPYSGAEMKEFADKLSEQGVWAQVRGVMPADAAS